MYCPVVLVRRPWTFPPLLVLAIKPQVAFVAGGDEERSGISREGYHGRLLTLNKNFPLNRLPAGARSSVELPVDQRVRCDDGLQRHGPS
jgi:hypothetical protein